MADAEAVGDYCIGATDSGNPHTVWYTVNEGR